MILENILVAAVRGGTPILFATLGETITEKSGNLNLGVEGMMLMGAVAGFQIGMATSNPWLAVIGSLIAGAVAAFIYAFLTVTLRTNQVVTGLALTTFGTGISSFAGQALRGKVVPPAIMDSFKGIKIPLLGDIPVIGKVLFQQDAMVYLGYLCAILMGIYLYRTRKGLNLRIVGENPAAADAAGINVTLYKYAHILAGGALCGIGGAYMSLVHVPAWKDSITGGRGWIAVALVIFISWNPYLAMLGAYFFGALDILGFYINDTGIHISQYFFDMLPYVATILVLVITCLVKSKDNGPPKALGNAYFREER